MKTVDQVIRQLHLKSILIATTLLFVILLFNPQIGNSAGVFGNGSDGPLTVAAGTHHLAGNMQFTDLTINGGALLETHGYEIKISGTLTNSGTITDSYSGGNGGTIGAGGNGGNYGTGHTPPIPGGSGTPGSAASVSGGGSGGHGGSGGGGGGGAWDTGANDWGRGGNGGSGGYGGNGGGVITIYAQIFNNSGAIKADGYNGTTANYGQTGTYDSWFYLFVTSDGAGGGGGGGAGGNGGNAGTVQIYYGTLINAGAVTANGGSGGASRSGGSGIGTNYGSSGSQYEENGAGGGPSPTGGTGGRGEIGSGGSNSGATGQNGATGSNGSTSITAIVICYVDADGDGYGTGTGVPSASCGVGFANNDLDCNDGNAAINPGATEACNSLDDNCNSAIDEGFDADFDGFTSCAGDCDDSDPTVYPGAPEISCDGIDNDCNPGTPDAEDADGDTFTSCSGDCDDSDPTIYPGAPEIQCDGIDNDCDPATPDAIDADSDGYSVCDDCDDSNVTIHPGAPEVVGDGIDQDCDGVDDVNCYPDLDGDGFGDGAHGVVIPASQCGSSSMLFDGSDCDDNDPTIYPGAVEILGNGIDEDCDGIDASCCIVDRGNVNGGPDDGTFIGSIDISDLIYLVSFMFQGGNDPVCMEEADINGSGGNPAIDISDLIALVGFMFQGGGPPASCL